MAKIFVAAIALGAFFANPTWGVDGLPRSADGSPIVDRWIQPGESFFLNPDHWVQIYQAYATQVPGGPTISVDLPSKEQPKPEPEPTATESVAIAAPDQVDQAPPAPDQAEQAAPAPEAPAPAPEPAPKKPSSRKKAATPAPAPEASPAPAPAPEAAPDPAPEATAPEAPPAPSGAAQE